MCRILILADIRPMHTVSSQDFRSLPFSVMHRNFFREIETFTIKLSHLTNFFQHHKSMLKGDEKRTKIL